jgi:O-methyltransferase
MPNRQFYRNPHVVIARLLGYELSRSPSPQMVARTHPELAADAAFVGIAARTGPFTMTTIERMWALYSSVHNVVDRGIAGDIVECGVWKGGSSMLAASTLAQLGVTDRDLYLYDTFEGMSEPTELDVGIRGERVADEWERYSTDLESPVLAYAGIEEVRSNMATTGYPADRIHYVRGKVEDTIPATIPERIALLRLDTDWYESTRHELEHLYPLLEPGGILIIDDYGDWQGARKAVDEWLASLADPPLMTRLDHTGRIIVKPGR